jgi:hypothetical protein
MEKKRKGSAGRDDTASMIKGGGYIGARTRHPPPLRKQLEKKIMWDNQHGNLQKKLHASSR